MAQFAHSKSQRTFVALLGVVNDRSRVRKAEGREHAKRAQQHHRRKLHLVFQQADAVLEQSNDGLFRLQQLFCLRMGINAKVNENPANLGSATSEVLISG